MKYFTLQELLDFARTNHGRNLLEEQTPEVFESLRVVHAQMQLIHEPGRMYWAVQVEHGMPPKKEVA